MRSVDVIMIGRIMLKMQWNIECPVQEISEKETSVGTRWGRKQPKCSDIIQQKIVFIWISIIY